MHDWAKRGGLASYRSRCFTEIRRATSTKDGAAFRENGLTGKSCLAIAKNISTYEKDHVQRHLRADAFAYLIDKVSGRGTWARNPWVVAYEYELIK